MGLHTNSFILWSVVRKSYVPQIGNVSGNLQEGHLRTSVAVCVCVHVSVSVFLIVIKTSPVSEQHAKRTWIKYSETVLPNMSSAMFDMSGI